MCVPVELHSIKLNQSNTNDDGDKIRQYVCLSVRIAWLHSSFTHSQIKKKRIDMMSKKRESKQRKKNVAKPKDISTVDECAV